MLFHVWEEDRSVVYVVGEFDTVCVHDLSLFLLHDALWIWFVLQHGGYYLVEELVFG